MNIDDLRSQKKVHNNYIRSCALYFIQNLESMFLIEKEERIIKVGCFSTYLYFFEQVL